MRITDSIPMDNGAVNIQSRRDSRRRRTVVVVMLLLALIALGTAAWVSCFGKRIIFKSVRLVGVSEAKGRLSIWYFHPPVSWHDDRVGADLLNTATEQQIRFAVTNELWPFSHVDREVEREIVYDQARKAFRLDVDLEDGRQVVVMSSGGDRVVLWPRDEPIKLPVHLGALLRSDAKRQRGQKSRTARARNE